MAAQDLYNFTDSMPPGESEEESEEDDEEEGSSESGSGSSTGTEEEGETEESEEEEEDEPVLKYRRFAKEVVGSIGTQEMGQIQIRCIAVHTKFIALGRSDGTLQLLDHNGTVLPDKAFYALHSSVINQIAVDEEGEHIASCSDDRKVIVIGLFATRYSNVTSYDKPVKSVAIHPYFGKGTNHVIVVGTDKLSMIEERRWPLGNKTTEIHGGGGPISVIKWKKNLIAWANDKAALVYDVALKEIITSISFEEEIPRRIPCCLYWQSPDVLLVGRGHLVKTATVKGGGVAIDPGTPDAVAFGKKHMAITAQNSFQQFLVCGVVPIAVNQEWKLVMLGYSGDIDQDRAAEEGNVPPPHLVVVSPGHYLPEKMSFDVPEFDARDKLLPKGHQFCKCEEYKIDCVLNDGKLYILTPVDMILAEKRGPDDHVDWLIKTKKDYESAMAFVENPEVARVMVPGRVKEIGMLYLYHLIRSGKFSEAARKCPEVLGNEERYKERWEDIIISFYKAEQLNEIRPFIPLNSPQLSPALYELILNDYLKKDCEMLYSLIKEWPNTLYNTQAIINVVDDKLRDNPKDSGLLKVKARLHEDLNQYDEALKIYLQQGHKEVFDLIHAKKLYSALLENLIPLLEVDTVEGVRVLVNCKEDIPPKRVVNELESSGREDFLHKYLDCIFDRNPKAGSEFHEQQVELYAKHEPEKLLLFLRSCNDIRLEKALQVCEHYGREEERVYLLARMGNPKEALKLIINKLQNVDKAIEFAMEEDDAELWEVLINLSIHKPRFITGLLNNVGTHIDPTRLIKKIPDHTEIPDLGPSLVKLMQDFRIQVNLREGCKKILVKDSHVLMEKLVQLQQKAIYIDDEAICRTCGSEVVGMDENTDYIVFFCGHVYHKRCVSKRNEMMVCRLCYTSAKSRVKKGQVPRFMS